MRSLSIEPLFHQQTVQSSPNLLPFYHLGRTIELSMLMWQFSVDLAEGFCACGVWLLHLQSVQQHEHSSSLPSHFTTLALLEITWGDVWLTRIFATCLSLLLLHKLFLFLLNFPGDLSWERGRQLLVKPLYYNNVWCIIECLMTSIYPPLYFLIWDMILIWKGSPHKHIQPTGFVIFKESGTMVARGWWKRDMENSVEWVHIFR